MKRKKIRFTKDGYQKLKTDFQNLTLKRKEAVKTLSRAREMGDLSENGLYKAARFELSSIDRELRRFKYLLNVGEIVEPANKGFIDFGNKVIVDDGQKQKTFTLVNVFESDPKQEKLSIHSPLGKAIMGKRVGDKVIVTSPSGQKTYTIIGLE